MEITRLSGIACATDSASGDVELFIRRGTIDIARAVKLCAALDGILSSCLRRADSCVNVQIRRCRRPRGFPRVREQEEEEDEEGEKNDHDDDEERRRGARRRSRTGSSKDVRAVVEPHVRAEMISASHPALAWAETLASPGSVPRAHLR